jgi:molybdopterin-guanine dinucleotide biosynthesis protein A
VKYEVCGVILSGGESRRFGKPKAFETFNDIPFWEHSYNALKNCTDTQVIISHPTLEKKFLGMVNDIPVILDDKVFRGKGPMAGIYSAMREIESEWYVILSCDIPRINEQTIHHLLTFRDPSKKAIVPIIDDRIQPLIALYHHSIFEKVEELLENDCLKVMSLLKEIEVLYVTEKDLKSAVETFENINHQEEFKLLKKMKK